ncbi:MAG: hypothetical protein ABWY29_13485 [Blastococcus sp.]
MARWLYVVVIGAVVSGFAFLLLTGQYINDGPVLVSLGHDHGLHEGDLFVVAGWLASMAALVALAASSRRRGAP